MFKTKQKTQENQGGKKQLKAHCRSVFYYDYNDIIA